MRYYSPDDVHAELKKILPLAAARYKLNIESTKVQNWPFPKSGIERLSSAIFQSFPIGKSIEGYDFWLELYNALTTYETIGMVRDLRT